MKRAGAGRVVLLRLSLLAMLLFASCAPKEVQGEVVREEWSEYELTAWTRITSGDVVGLRFRLSRNGSPGFDPLTLKNDSLTGKRIRCELASALAVQRCVVLGRKGEHRIKRLDER